jgi:hypothetical protein
MCVSSTFAQYSMVTADAFDGGSYHAPACQSAEMVCPIKPSKDIAYPDPPAWMQPPPRACSNVQIAQSNIEARGGMSD